MNTMKPLPYADETFRGFLDRLRAEKELVDIKQPVDSRHIATLVDQSDKALLFHQVIGYDMPVVSGIIRSQKRAIMSMGCETYPEIEFRLERGIANPLAPRYVENAALKQVIKTGKDVDLFSLPIPMFSIYDGGPMITAGITIARDPEYGLNSGIYRFMVKERNLTGIDIVTPNNMRLFAQRAFERGEALPISISIGNHPFENLGSGFRAPLGTDEMGIAGGIRGKAIELAQCETIDLPCIADSEIVLEGEILPTGWTQPEGRFGEFTRLMGGLHWNPVVRINAITMRKDAIYYALHMPWENTWLMAPTLGGCGMWHAVVSIKKQAGEGKNALLAALSVMDLKHVVVVDDDIDVFNAMDVEWAIATRVQGDKDVVIIPGSRAKPLDPSLPVMPPGVVPTGAKVGIDATISEGIPKERFERIAYAYTDRAKIADYYDGKADPVHQASSGDQAVAELAGKIVAVIEKTPKYYSELAEQFADYDFSTVARALGKLHEDGKLWQDPRGRMCLRDSKFAAKPPVKGH
jgi:2,5-furandicarboxylate decarboxylase 1